MASKYIYWTTWEIATDTEYQVEWRENGHTVIDCTVIKDRDEAEARAAKKPYGKVLELKRDRYIQHHHRKPNTGAAYVG